MSTSEITLAPLQLADAASYPLLARLWNRACGPDFAITERFLDYNFRPIPGGSQAGCLASLDGAPCGFAIASRLQGYMDTNPDEIGWLEVLVVDPAFQKRGVGGGLLEWAEGWLKAGGCTDVHIGGGIRTFSAGLPEAFQTRDYFAKRGYLPPDFGEVEWDVGRDLGDGRPIARRPSPGPELIHPCQPGEQAALLEFLKRAFPGRWLYEVELFIADGGRLADILVATQGGRVEGFCWITLPDSYRPLERYYLARLPQPWGQLGPIGVSWDVQGQGLGGLLLQEGLLRLQRFGVRGCVIDWTGLLEFYGKYGFQPYTKYLTLIKSF